MDLAHWHVQLAMWALNLLPVTCVSQGSNKHGMSTYVICRQGSLLADWSSHAWGTQGIAGLCFPDGAADQGFWVLSSKRIVYAVSHVNTSPQLVLSLKVSLHD